MCGTIRRRLGKAGQKGAQAWYYHSMNPFSLFKGPRRVLGVDIGTTSIKVVEVEQARGSSRLVNYGILESEEALLRPTTAFQTSSLKLFENEIDAHLEHLLKEVQPKSTRVVASLPLFMVFTTVIAIPKMTAEEVQKTIAYQAKQYIPLPIEEVALDWLKVGEFTDERGAEFFRMMLISVPQEHIKKTQRIMASAGLALEAIEIEGLSLVRSLVGTDPTPTAIVDVGSRSTAIVLVENGLPQYMRQSDFAGSSLTQALSSSLNINPLRAEELKRERGIAGTGPNYELSTIMLPFVDAILSEVRRTEFDYHNQFPNTRKIERVILSGGGANLEGFDRYAKDQLGVPVVVASPFSRLAYPGEIEPIVGSLGGPLSVAIGLALRP